MNEQREGSNSSKLPVRSRLVRSRAYISHRVWWLGKLATDTAISLKEKVVSKETTVPAAADSNGKLRSKTDVLQLKKMVDQSKEVIAQVQTVFPLTLFPDDIILDRTKITIIKRNFFWSADVISVRIEDILNVSTSTGPFFGSITVSIRVMNSVDHFEVSCLWRRDALEVKALIQGYMIAKHSKVDLDNLSVEEMVDTLRDLGYDSGSSKK